MKKRPIELRLEALRQNPTDAPAVLREGLKDRYARVVTSAARWAGELEERSLIPDLKAACERLMVDGVKRDPACRGKLAILKALDRLQEWDAGLSLKALRYRQLEAGFGGREDTAAEVRGLGAVGLAQSGWPDAASELVELLADSEPSARLTGVRAMAFLGGPEGALVLRLKALLGDEEPAVVGECLDGLLRLEGAAGVPFVARFLPIRFEAAALALGSSRLPAALPPLKAAWVTTVDRGDKAVLLLALALLHASDFLLELVEDEWVAGVLDSLEPGLLEPVVVQALQSSSSSGRL